MARDEVKEMFYQIVHNCNSIEDMERTVEEQGYSQHWHHDSHGAKQGLRDVIRKKFPSTTNNRRTRRITFRAIDKANYLFPFSTRKETKDYLKILARQNVHFRSVNNLFIDFCHGWSSDGEDSDDFFEESSEEKRWDDVRNPKKIPRHSRDYRPREYNNACVQRIDHNNGISDDEDYDNFDDEDDGDDEGWDDEDDESWRRGPRSGYRGRGGGYGRQRSSYWGHRGGYRGRGGYRNESDYNHDRRDGWSGTHF